MDSGLGVNGSIQAAGLSSSGSGSSGGSTGGATIQQVGVVTPNLDPVLQNSTTFEHLSQPQLFAVVSGTQALIQTIRTYSTFVQEGFLTGGYVRITDYEQFLQRKRSHRRSRARPRSLYECRHPAQSLQGFGVKLNDRFIRIAQTQYRRIARGFSLAITQL